MAGDLPRRSAALAASLALHAGVAAFLAGQAIVRLDVEPITIDLSTLANLQASNRTAGPGERSPQLQIAAPAPPAPAVAQPVTASPPAPVEKPVAQEVAEPVPTPAPQPKRAPTRPAAPAPVELASKSPGTSADSQAAGGTGSAPKATAPAWAPAARVRYESLLFAWMDRHKQYPMLAQRRGLEGTGSVRVRIDREGHVLDRAVTASTGEAMLDEAALDMVRRASPFPAVPPEYAGETFEFVAPIQYRLR